MPRHSQAMIMARYYKAKEKEHLHFAPLIDWINPYSGQVVSSRFWGDFIMTWIYDLHYALLMGKLGQIIMGFLGISLILVVLIGLYLWWPKAGKFNTAFTFKLKASKERYIYDLHKISGVYSIIFLLFLLVSGVVLELPEYVNPLIERHSPLFKTPELSSQFMSGKTRISLDEAAGIASREFHEAKLRWLETPKDEFGVYHLRLYQDGESGERFPKTFVWLDQYSGQVLAVRDPLNESWGRLSQLDASPAQR